METMKNVLYFYLNGCPYCRNANKAIDTLLAEEPKYADVQIDRVEENAHPEIADRYDYYRVPTMYIDGEKLYEAKPGQGYEEIKANVKRVLDAALV